MKEKNKNEYYFYQLPKHIQKQVIVNTLDIDGSGSLEEYLKRTENSIIGFLTGVFQWDQSKEGVHYWIDLQNLYADAIRKNIDVDLESFYKKYPEYSKRNEIINNYSIY